VEGKNQRDGRGRGGNWRSAQGTKKEEKTSNSIIYFIKENILVESVGLLGASRRGKKEKTFTLKAAKYPACKEERTPQD